MKTVLFILNACAFGVALAMDAFSVSVVSGLNDPQMKNSRRCLIAATFALFQIIMPLAGWLCVHTILTLFSGLSFIIPWVALALLLYLGIRMIYETVKNEKTQEEKPTAPSFSLGTLLLQGIATSIDALSVGFTIANLNFADALSESLIIGIVTFGLCLLGLLLGQKIGKKVSKAGIIGGIILILIGLEIVITNLF